MLEVLTEITSILSDFNKKRCTNPLILKILRNVSINFDSGYYMSFYSHCAILCNNDENQQIWKIKGIWNTKKIDTIIMGSTNRFINRYLDGNWFSYYFSKCQNEFFEQNYKNKRNQIELAISKS